MMIEIQAKTLVLIPAYNEEKNLTNLIKEIRSNLINMDILVVNDGSTDGTACILDKIIGIRVLHLPYNIGIGGTILTGFHYFLEKPYKYLIRIDGDGQHPPRQARKLLDIIISGKADMVIGSRFIEKKGFQSTLARRGGIKLLNILAAFFLKQKITDNTSGFKAYNRRSVENLLDDYPFDYPEPIEVYLLVKKGLTIKEVPVHMRERREGFSSISQLDSYYYLIKVILTILIKHSIRGKK
jgi:glycosyltransferase involved in cell wall biosynthesis